MNEPTGLLDIIRDKILELSPSGYVLFFLSPEGNPRISFQSESSMTTLSLESFASLWFKSNQKIRENELTELIQRCNAPTPDSDEDDEE